MQDFELTLRDYINLFLRRWWIIALVTGACLALSLAWTARQTELYQSSAAILINQGSAADLFDPTSGSGSSSNRIAENETRLLESGLVSKVAIEKLGYEAYIDGTTDGFADVIEVNARSSDPARAQKIAQTYAEAYIQVRRDRFVTQRLSTAAKLIERLDELDAQIEVAEGDELIRLQLQRRELAESSDLLNLAVDIGDDTGGQIIDDAYLPGAPFTPRVKRNFALGGILGLMFGSGLVLFIDALDRSVKSREMLESLTPGAPNLALIPSFGRGTERANALVSLRDPNSTSAEAFRTLRAALQYVAVDESIRVIQIASAHSAAGKTTVAANLAVTLAAAGQSVAVVDADLRRPRLHQVFDVPQVPGLTSAIIGAVPVANCVHEVAGVGTVAPLLIPSGPIPPGPAELLGSAAGQRTIEQVKEMVDVVIIDTPPVLAVADTMVLSRYVDASILIVDAKRTNRNDVTQAYERLIQSGAPVVGTVLNRASFGGAGGYGYGYQSDQSNRVAGWFARRGDGRPVETLSGSDIPHIELAAREADANNSAPTPVANGAAGSGGQRPFERAAVAEPTRSATVEEMLQPAPTHTVAPEWTDAPLAPTAPESPRSVPAPSDIGDWADEVVLRDI